MLRRLLSWSLLATAALAFLQLLVVASDVAGQAPSSSFGSVDAAMTTDAGMALAIRIVLALVMWVLLFQYELVHPDVYWAAVTLPGLGLLATWAFAGHSASMRWPAIGVATDVAHHAAAAAWIAGLAIVGWIVIPTCESDVVVPAVRRFSRLAAVSVTVLVVTGLVQTVRLVGNPIDLFEVNHGRYLAVKIALLVVMLAVANINRRRIDQRLDDTDSIDRHIAPLRQAILAEFRDRPGHRCDHCGDGGFAAAHGLNRHNHRTQARSQRYTTSCRTNPEKVVNLMKIRRLVGPSIVIALTTTLAACGSDDSPAAETASVVSTEPRHWGRQPVPQQHPS